MRRSRGADGVGRGQHMIDRHRDSKGGREGGRERERDCVGLFSPLHGMGRETERESELMKKRQ